MDIWFQLWVTLLTFSYRVSFVIFILTLLQCFYYHYSCNHSNVRKNGEVISTFTKTNTLHRNHVVKAFIAGVVCFLLSFAQSMFLGS